MVIEIMRCVRVNGIMTYTGCFCIVFFVFFGEFAKLQKSDCWLRHVHLSVRMEQLCSNWTGFREILYLSIFSKICLEKLSFLKI